ncbi:uncharacterized protein LOC143461064 isoform X2 [Clavelina lepadiformis]|uniref:uncharacterized protein LOC143461064 isoform X2 n=1 Tax=Clavelina lepadiformis TaxID=159417 RepID=UPI004041534F
MFGVVRPILLRELSHNHAHINYRADSPGIMMATYAREVLIILLYLGSFQMIEHALASDWSEWSSWSGCSVTCGPGVRHRQRLCIQGDSLPRDGGRPSSCRGSKILHDKCYAQLCPSYLDWPRIHFKGKFVSDVPTTNNFRCFFQPDGFCPTCSTNRAKTGTMASYMKGTSLPRFEFTKASGNALGNGHFYFHETKVMSACWSGKSDCVIKDPIVGRKIENPYHARMVDLDPDWQQASEIIGLKIHIPGVLSAPMSRAVLTSFVRRQLDNDDTTAVVYYKGKLTNIKWIDPVYKEKFRNATELSMRFYLDQFQFEGMSGRLTGTIGMTSPDDCLMAYGARLMKSYFYGEVPFHVNRMYKKLVIDMGGVIPCSSSGNFSVSELYLKVLDVVVLPTSDEFCNLINCEDRVLPCDGETYFMLTQGGALNMVHTSQQWYSTYGGIVEISLHWASDAVFDMLSNSRLGIVNQSSTPDLQFRKSKKLSYSICEFFPGLCDHRSTLDENCQIFVMENPNGINIKPKQHITRRLNRGETWKIQTLSSSYGRPVINASVELRIINTLSGLEECKTNPVPCSPVLASPKDILRLKDLAYTDANGLAELSVGVVGNPGFPRQCGLDGQIYPLGFILTYSTPTGRATRIGEGGMFDGIFKPFVQAQARQQCNLQQAFSTVPLALKVFGSLPESLMRKTCPSWEDGVQNIFSFYADIAPAMEKRGVIDLKDVNVVREKLHLINMSMFEFDWEHPNFMPTTRDLSGDKTELIRRWIECEASGSLLQGNGDSSKRTAHKITDVCGTSDNLQQSLAELHDLLQFAIWIELYLLPPYLTAYLSIKQAANKEIRRMLRSIASEEMLHLTLDANVLNAIGGNPNLTDSYWLPSYPTPFPSKTLSFPGLTLRLEKFSTSIAREIFSEIEKPSAPEVSRIIQNIAKTWEKLPADKRCSIGSQQKWKKQSLRNSKASNKTFFDDDNWKNIFQNATRMLEEPRLLTEYTIGSYYTKVMLHLIQLESCIKAISPNKTIFTGDPDRQLGMRHWYASRGLSSGVLFPVFDLKSAIEALLEVVYEGEGGSPCVPYITDLGGDVPSSMNSQTAHDGIITADIEKSHYVKFQELAHSRRLVAVHKEPPPWAGVACMPQPDAICSDSLNARNSNRTSRILLPSFCYVGEQLSIDEKEDVWPIAHIPISDSSPDQDQYYLKKVAPQTRRTSLEFNMIYTNLLHCLESAMNGNVNKMPTCMGKMYELLGAGQKLVQMPIYSRDKSSIEATAAPSWTYLTDPYKEEGENIIDQDNIQQHELEFC